MIIISMMLCVVQC